MAKTKDDRLEDLKTSFEKVWLAGLGALAQAEKQGDKLFKTLVKKGKKYEVFIPVAEDAVKESVKAARKQANDAFRGMEAAFDRQVKAAVKRAGLASKKDVEALKKEIAALKKSAKSTRASTRTRVTTTRATKKKKTLAKTKKKPATKKRAKR